MTKQYDLIVIGTGTAAAVAAMRVRAANRRVAIIDYRPFGGTCALRGCDPKKMLVGGTSAIDHVRRMHGKGVAGDSRIDWPQLMAFKRTFTDPVPPSNERRLAEKGIDAYHGHARFSGRNTMVVNGEELEAKHVLIATGAEPVELGIPGENHLVTNEGFLSLDTLPRRIVMVGGGYIAAEFSHIAARAGSHVTILQHGQRMLPQFDPDLVDWLMPSFHALGIDVHTNTSVNAIAKTDGAYCVQASSPAGQMRIDADLVVHAAGRAPAFDALGLQAAGIEIDHGRLVLNEFMQSISNPCVYAAGDAAQVGPPLTPVAGHDGKIVSMNILEGNHQRPDYRGVPSVAFTTPAIASVGLAEAAARERGLKFRMQSEQATSWFTAQQAAEPVYGFKVLVDETSDLILGAHLVGPHVEELINLFALAIRHDLTAEKLKTTMFAYPTAASDIGYML